MTSVILYMAKAFIIIDFFKPKKKKITQGILKNISSRYIINL